MDRKQFVSIALKAPAAMFAAGCCCAVADNPPAAQPGRDPNWDFTQRWVKLLMDNADANLDEASRRKLMDAQGRACFRARHPGASPKAEPGDLDKLLGDLKKFAGEQGVKRAGNVIELQYPKGPNGEARCLCPLVRSGPARLSRTYCLCSAGYVAEMFERSSTLPLKVTLTESLKAGAAACRFRVELQA